MTWDCSSHLNYVSRLYCTYICQSLNNMAKRLWIGLSHQNEYKKWSLQPSRVLFHYLYYITVRSATFQSALWEHSGQDSNPVQCTVPPTWLDVLHLNLRRCSVHCWASLTLSYDTSYPGWMVFLMPIIFLNWCEKWRARNSCGHNTVC